LSGRGAGGEKIPPVGRRYPRNCHGHFAICPDSPAAYD
jgi:hypothetical protein